MPRPRHRRDNLLFSDVAGGVKCPTFGQDGLLDLLGTGLGQADVRLELLSGRTAHRQSVRRTDDKQDRTLTLRAALKPRCCNARHPVGLSRLYDFPRRQFDVDVAALDEALHEPETFGPRDLHLAQLNSQLAQQFVDVDLEEALDLDVLYECETAAGESADRQQRSAYCLGRRVLECQQYGTGNNQ